MAEGARISSLRARAAALEGCGVAVVGTVVARREHSALTFADVEEAGGGSLQVALRAGELSGGAVLVAALALRPGSAVRVAGALQKTRSGELTLFGTSVALLGLPPADPPAALAALQLVDSNALTEADAAAALGCSVAAIVELRAVLRVGDGGGAALCAQAETRLVAALEVALRGGRKERCERRRAPPFGAEQLAQLDALAAAHPAHVVAAEVAKADAAVAFDDVAAPAAAADLLGASASAAVSAAARLRWVREARAAELGFFVRHVTELLDARRRRRGGGGSTVVELLCGRGELCLRLAAADPSLCCVGVESNAEAVSNARAAAAAAGIANARFVHVDLARLQLALAGGAGEVSELLRGADVVLSAHGCGGIADAVLSLAGRHAASALVGCCCAGAWPQLCPADGAWAVSATERELLCAAADDEPAAAATAVAARRVVGALRVEARGGGGRRRR